MRNLAGVKECDEYIAEELRDARIPTQECDLTQSEVPYTIVGCLGPIVFRRAWYYWVAEGKIPLSVAQELYADPIGKQDVRVAGHCGRPAPEDPWIDYIDADGYKLCRQEQYPDFVRCFQDDLPKILEKQKHRFSEDRRRDGVGYITCYHIDTMEGLRLFADAVHKMINV